MFFFNKHTWFKGGSTHVLFKRTKYPFQKAPKSYKDMTKINPKKHKYPKKKEAQISFFNRHKWIKDGSTRAVLTKHKYPIKKTHKYPIRKQHKYRIKSTNVSHLCWVIHTCSCTITCVIVDFVATFAILTRTRGTFVNTGFTINTIKS